MENINNLTIPTQNYLRELEHKTIELISERLGKIGKTSHDDLKSLMELQNINGDIEAIKNFISEIIDKANEEMYNIIKEAARRFYDETAAKYDVQITPFEKNRKISALIEKVRRESIKSGWSNTQTDECF